MRRCGNDVWDTRPREGGKLAAWYLPSQRKAKKGTLLHGIHQRSAFSTGVLVKKTTGPDRFLRVRRGISARGDGGKAELPNEPRKASNQDVYLSARDPTHRASNYAVYQAHREVIIPIMMVCRSTSSARRKASTGDVIPSNLLLPCDPECTENHQLQHSCTASRGRGISCCLGGS